MIYDFQHEFLGTLLKINIESDIDPSETIKKIYDLCEQFENTYSRFKYGNFLDKLNTSKESLNIDYDFYEMMKFSLELSEITGGYFDPTIISMLENYGYDIEYSMTTKTLSSTRYGYKNINLEKNKIKLNNGIKIELGGVGKGFLIDKITILLNNYTKYCIDFGGDIYCRGSYIVALEHPLEPGLSIGTIEVKNFAVASSSPSKRKYNNFHHLLNPFTAKPVDEIIGVFTQSSNVFRADGFSTALFVTPIQQTLNILNTQSDLDALIVFEDGSYFHSPGYKGKLFT